MHRYEFKIDPITRIEGHLGIEVIVEKDRVIEAGAKGTLFRGFEIILKGRNPLDAPRFSQRICGVCPASHSKASSLALDKALNISRIPKNATIIRSLILGANFLQSHILHFYHLSLLDYVDISKVVGETPPFSPSPHKNCRLPPQLNEELSKHYLQALEIRRGTHKLLALLGEKMPHNIGIVAGGVTEKVSEDKITNFLWRLNQIREFIDNVYIPNLFTLGKYYPDCFNIGRSYQRFLAYGGLNLGEEILFESGVLEEGKLFEFNSGEIREKVTSSWYRETSPSPLAAQTEPSLNKEKAYSFIKSPRYQGKPSEVGPLARLLINYSKGKYKAKDLLNKVLSELNIEFNNLSSVLGRHLARALEAKIVAEAMAEAVLKLEPAEPVITPHQIPESSQGEGLTEAPRGSLGHWVVIADKKIKNYQVITPAAWNASPKDDQENPGPLEKALEGIKIEDKENPLEIVRVVRSFDPCLACAVHLISFKGRKIGEFKVV
ncbi:MAG TPA: nickel-dependent hydrogenase large subunit [Candidatus Omnitrophica bacterium]|nr:MAG: nickel-dependent hydrogenase large subunit [Candidatus Omnitrophota bacterium]HEC69580.1 nickel-dependent hydrogenase large subunit [Candidatus Omnitrophota bacterium]